MNSHPSDRELLSARWIRFSKLYRRKNPLCVLCEAQGFTVACTEVDHIIPRARGGAVWSEKNLQSLCKKCHSLKTRWERTKEPSIRIIEKILNDGSIIYRFFKPELMKPGCTAKEAGELPNA